MYNFFNYFFFTYLIVLLSIILWFSYNLKLEKKIILKNAKEFKDE